MSVRFMLAAALLAGTASAAAPALAQAPQAAPAAAATNLPPANPQAVVAQVRRIIADRYVLPERRPALDAVLAEGLSSGRYAVTDSATLAQRINEDLARVGQDGHLNFRFDPRQAQMLAAAGGGAGGPSDPSAMERQVRANNHGVRELRVLPGNIRYMDYRGFEWIGPESAAALENAMRFLSGGDAIVIDLRYNGGGDPAAVQYLVSHFMEPGRPLMTFHMNGQPSPDRTATLAELPAGRFVGKPLYVLTSPMSASAAEEFAGHVAGYRLGELVGGNTAGAGFRNDMVPIEGGYLLSVSVGRAVLAATGRDWEGVGIAPTIQAQVPQALDAAQAHALRRLATTAPEAERPRLAALADALTARFEPRTAALPLSAYAGRFGERVVTLDGNRLTYRFADRPVINLLPLGGNRFALDSDPAVQVNFAAAGDRVSGFEMTTAGYPEVRRYERTQ